MLEHLMIIGVIGQTYVCVGVGLDFEVVVKEIRNDSNLGYGVSILLVDGRKMVSYKVNFHISHVLRESKKCANFLANFGQACGWRTTVLDHPLDNMRDQL